MVTRQNVFYTFFRFFSFFFWPFFFSHSLSYFFWKLSFLYFCFSLCLLPASLVLLVIWYCHIDRPHFLDPFSFLSMKMYGFLFALPLQMTSPLFFFIWEYPVQKASLTVEEEVGAHILVKGSLFPFFNWCHSLSRCFHSLVFAVFFFFPS